MHDSNDRSFYINCTDYVFLHYKIINYSSCIRGPKKDFVGRWMDHFEITPFNIIIHYYIVLESLYRNYEEFFQLFVSLNFEDHSRTNSYFSKWLSVGH